MSTTACQWALGLCARPFLSPPSHRDAFLQHRAEQVGLSSKQEGGDWNPQVVTAQPYWDRVPTPRPARRAVHFMTPASSPASSYTDCPAGRLELLKWPLSFSLLPPQLPPFLPGPLSLDLFPVEKGRRCYLFLKASASSLPPMSGLPPVSHRQPYHVGLWLLGSVCAFLTRLWT